MIWIDEFLIGAYQTTTMASTMTYEQWCARATELQDKHGHTGKPKGHLAEVSIYEFVNDWLRPEVAWQIYSYVGGEPNDDHKDAIQKRLRRAGKTETKFVSVDGHCGHLRCPITNRSSSGYIIPKPSYTLAGRNVLDEEWTLRMVWLYQDNRASNACVQGVKDGRVLIHYNPTLSSLAGFHRMTKKALADKLRELNVKGRTKIMKTYDVGGHHQPQIVTAIMKSPNYSAAYLDRTNLTPFWTNQREYNSRHINTRTGRPPNDGWAGAAYNDEGGWMADEGDY